MCVARSASLQNAAATPPDPRQAIIDLANSLIGSHYLWGAGGDAPMTNVNGVSYRPTSTTMATASKNASNLAVCAAQCNAAGYYVCSGRFRAAGVGGSIVTPQDAGLQAYLKALGQDTTQWAPNAQGLSPRKIVGDGIVDTDKTVITGQIVWGEDCRTKQHFDCVFFVMYCYAAIVQGNWHWAIAQWGSNVSGTGPVKDPKSLLPADILIRPNHHIGMYDGQGNVVQAQMSATGVLSEPFVASTWQVYRRVPDNLMIPL
jgi:cell wall-associated NlpC family hydrolase